MLSAEQHTARLNGIGGSDIAAVLNVCPWRQPIDVFYDKRPDLAAEAAIEPRVVEGDAVNAGFFNEDAIAQMWAKKHGKKLRKSNRTKIHRTAEWLVANIDRAIVGAHCGLEIKNVGMYMASRWGKSDTDEAAEYYIPQVHQYMLVMDYPEWILTALIGGSDLRDYHFQRDPEMDELILDTSRDFWKNHVTPGIPPVFDADHPQATSALKRIYPLINDDVITLDADARHWHYVKEQAACERKRYQQVEDTATAHIAALAQNAGKIYIPDVKGAYVRTQQHRKATTLPACDFIQMRYSRRSK